jgi:acetyl esterase
MIDPQAEPVLKAMNAGPPLDQVGLDAARQWSAERTRVAITPVAKTTDLAADGGNGVAVRLYHPSPSDVLPMIVFSHSGGWILGTVASADETCRRLALASGCALVSVEYRLAPEFPYPAAVDDVLTVLRWLPSIAGEHNLDVSRVAVAGESSGAQIALSVALAARDAGQVLLRGQLLVCPPVDRHMDTPAWRDLGDDFVPRRSQMAWMWDLYFGADDEHLGTSPDPFTADLTGMPPAVIVVAEYDPLRDEGLTLAERLRAAGAAAEVIDCAGQIHPVISHAPYVDACAAYLEQAGQAVAALLRSDAGMP